jgi:hypothetical protein
LPRQARKHLNPAKAKETARQVEAEDPAEADGDEVAPASTRLMQ